jgi:hypothetical protein
VKANPFTVSRILILLLLVTGVNVARAQKYVLIEKRGNPKTERIALYEYLIFQLKDDEKIWYNRQILGLNADAQMILLGDSWLPLSDISRIQLHRERGWVNILGTALQAGGVSMILTDAYFTIINEHQYSEGGWEWGLVNIAVGTGLKAVLSKIRYRLNGLNGRHRLRIVDLTF